MTTYAITGANGLVGSATRALLRDRGHRVVSLVRNPGGADETRFTLESEVPLRALEGVDTLIHAAHDFKARSAAAARATNVVCSIRLFETARSAGVKRLVFVSSVSAHEACSSQYGRGKLEVEAALAKLGGISVRPGLVWGRSGQGMFSVLGRVSRLGLVPVFDGGHQPLVLAHVDDVAAALCAACERVDTSDARPMIAAHPRVWEFGALLRALAAGQGKKLRTVSAPSWLALGAMRVVERAGLPLPFRSDSLVSLINPDPALDFWATAALRLSFRDYPAAGPVGG